MSETISGIVIEIPGSELAQHLTERAKHHADKESFYQEQVTSLLKGRDENANVTNDPVGSLKQSRAQHANKRAFFQFLATHVVSSATYRLSDDDLARMEVYSKYL